MPMNKDSFVNLELRLVQSWLSDCQWMPQLPVSGPGSKAKEAQQCLKLSYGCSTAARTVAACSELSKWRPADLELEIINQVKKTNMQWTASRKLKKTISIFWRDGLSGPK
jgi:hypothetical protein